VFSAYNSRGLNLPSDASALYRCEGVPLNSSLRKARSSAPGVRCVLFHSGLALVAVLVAGCSVQRPTVGPIEFVDSTGAPAQAATSLAVNQTVYLVATVTNDNEQLGISWTANCGSLPSGEGTNGAISTVCGTLSPAETESGPVPTYPSTGIITEYTAPAQVPKGNTITITAHATSLPSVTASVTLTIVASS
jgi:hypothetical protein